MWPSGNLDRLYMNFKLCTCMPCGCRHRFLFTCTIAIGAKHSQLYIHGLLIMTLGIFRATFWVLSVLEYKDRTLLLHSVSFYLSQLQHSIPVCCVNILVDSHYYYCGVWRHPCSHWSGGQHKTWCRCIFLVVLSTTCALSNSCSLFSVPLPCYIP